MMRTTETLRLLLGACVIYGVMAACSSKGITAFNASVDGDDGGPVASSGSGSSGGSHSSGSGSSGGSGSGSPVPDANADETQSGSRLKAAYYVGSDGSKQFAHWVDTARNGESCAFAPASDGSTRCLPSSLQYTFYFSNAGCTLPLLILQSDCSPPAYASTFVGSTCTTTSTGIFPVTTPSGLATVYVKSGASCTSTPTSAGYIYYSTGALIPASSFQDATLQTE